MLIKIKALSVNACYRGRRFKTPVYKAYEKELLLKLPKMAVPEGELELIIQFGFSSKLSDIDNGVKTFIDVLQKKYDFNDRRIYRLVVNKVIVKKGDEYINFKIGPLE